MNEDKQAMIDRLNKPIVIPNPCEFGVRVTEIHVGGFWQNSFKKVLIENGWKIKINDRGEEDFVAPVEKKLIFFDPLLKELKSCLTFKIQ